MVGELGIKLVNMREEGICPDFLIGQIDYDKHKSTIEILGLEELYGDPSERNFIGASRVVCLVRDAGYCWLKR